MPADPTEHDAYPSPADLIEAHAGALGISLRTARHHVLHRGALEAVAMRPQTHAHYRGADDIEQAAVLAEGLCRDHCFVDGNKRTAWAATLTFLLVRTGRTVPTSAEAAEMMLHLTLGDVDASDVARWLRRALR